MQHIFVQRLSISDDIPVFVLTDLHQNVFALVRMVKKIHVEYPTAKIILNGDFFDMYDTHLMCSFLVDVMNDPRFIIHYGNHDFQYQFDFNKSVRTSGRTDATMDIIRNSGMNSWVSRDVYWKFFTYIERENQRPILVSHAGVIIEYPLDYLDWEGNYCMTNSAFGNRSWMTQVGQVRGGPQDAIGGPLWLDWHYEFHPVDGLDQIVGHTALSAEDPIEVPGFEWGTRHTSNSNNWNIDRRGSFAVAKITKDKVEILENYDQV